MDREDPPVHALVELADTLVENYDPVEFLYTVSERCADVLEADGAGALLMGHDGRVELAAGSSHELRGLVLGEAQLGQGPCLAAFTTGEPVTEADLEQAHARWPEYTPRALRAGCRSVVAHPLQLREERLGALAVVWSEPAGFGVGDVRLARGVADLATIGILHARALGAAEEQIHNLRHALGSRAVVEQAKILLAERLSADPGDAFDWLRRYARDRNQRLRDVAQRFLDGELGEDSFSPE